VALRLPGLQKSANVGRVRRSRHPAISYDRNISPHSHFLIRVYIRIAFGYCYVITFTTGVTMSLFSVSALNRLWLAAILIVLIGLTVRWAVVLP
jgi:hypothetical protein